MPPDLRLMLERTLDGSRARGHDGDLNGMVISTAALAGETGLVYRSSARILR